MRFIRDRLRINRSKKDIIGLDIGCSSLKCVVLRSDEITVPCQLKNYSIKALPSVQNNSFKSQAVLTAIKELLAQASIESRYCVTALPDSLVSSKWIRIDYSATENIKLAINLAIEEHIAHPLDAIYFDYQIFDTQHDNTFLNILLVACRKEHLDTRIELLRQANLIPLVIEVNSHALERAYSHFYAPYIKDSILIDVGMSQLTLLFSASTKQMASYTEKILACDSKTVLQKIQRFINILFLSDPHYKREKILLIGTNKPLLDFIVKKLPGFCGLTVEILEFEKNYFSMNSLKEKEFKNLFPSLFLSIGLALRACLA